jgi:hypothetical protein
VRGKREERLRQPPRAGEAVAGVDDARAEAHQVAEGARVAGHDPQPPISGEAASWRQTNRALMARSGFRCCLFAYGGTVAPGDDLFRLRAPVSPWHLSPAHLGFESLFPAD